MRFGYEVLRGDARLATGFTVLACADRTGRPRRLPEAFRRQVEAASAPGKAAGPVVVQGEAAP
jgi:acyl-CoA thioesterase FadM